jgi:opacity protein-like surface antigen
MRQATIVFLLLFAAVTAFSQVAEVGMSAGASVLSNAKLATIDAGPPELTAKLSNGFRLGFRVTLNPYRFFGHEVGYAYNRTNLNIGGTLYGMGTHQGFYDFLVYATPEGSKVRPFAAAGAQFSNFVPPGSSAAQGGGSTKFGLNYGFGVKAKVAEKWLIRADFRQYASPKPDWFIDQPKGWLRINEISLGFAYTL